MGINIKQKEQELFKLLKDKSVSKVEIPSQVPTHDISILEKDNVFLKYVFNSFENVVRKYNNIIEDINIVKENGTVKINIVSSKDGEFRKQISNEKPLD